MRQISKSQIDLIDAVLAERQTGELTEALLEKDVHVTDALHGLFGLQQKYAEFVFCGGTSLSKAHGLVERMSEDVDLKIVLKSGNGLGRSALKKYLSELKYSVISEMINLGFVEDTDQRHARNENRYVATRWLYKSLYRSSASLRPYLSLETTVRTPQFATQSLPISYLVNRLAGLDGPTKLIKCVSVEETLAEKVLSFLRRHAQHRAGMMTQAWDEALVRHIYDVYCIMQLVPDAVEKARAHFPELVAFDVQEFNQHPAFCDNPKACMLAALSVAGSEAQTRLEYQNRLLPLVYGMTKPPFAEAFQAFRASSMTLLATL